MTKDDIQTETNVRIDNRMFPEDLREKLLDKLDEWEEFWIGRDIKTFVHQDALMLQIRLERSGNNIFFQVAEDGTGFEILAPIFAKFPKEASHFVLAGLTGSNATWRFTLVEESESESEQASAKSETLCAWAPMDIETFLNTDAVFLPSLIAKLDEADTCVKAHIEGKPVPELRLMA